MKEQNPDVGAGILFHQHPDSAPGPGHTAHVERSGRVPGGTFLGLSGSTERVI
jgi:hypothetical protein